jgi:hypothetical protein
MANTNYVMNSIFIIFLIIISCFLLVVILLIIFQFIFFCFGYEEQEYQEEQEDIELEEHKIDIEDLSKHVINVEHPIIPKDSCVICLGDFEENDTLCTLKYCEHTYHKHCIKNWIYEKPICPLCQIVII